MLLRCEVIVVNRCVSTTELRKCYATFCLLKKNDKCGEDVVSFVVHTSKNKSGDKYQVMFSMYSFKIIISTVS